MRSRVIRRRLYVASVPPGVPEEKLYEKLAQAIKAPYAEIRVKGGKVYVEVVGTGYEVREAWVRLRNALRDLWELSRAETEGRIAVDALAREAGRTFPPEALVYALRLRGYRASLERGEEGLVVATNAPLEEAVSLARAVAEAVEAVRFTVRGTAARRAVAALAAGLGLPPDEVVAAGLEEGVFAEDEDGKAVLRMEWRRAVSRLSVSLKGGRSG